MPGILDIGCEKAILEKPQEAYPKATFYSFDLQQLASRATLAGRTIGFVGDLLICTIQSKSMDVILTSSPLANTLNLSVS